MVNYKNVKRRRMKRREKGDKDEHIVGEIVEKIASQQAHTDWSGEQILSNCINPDDKKKRAKEEKTLRSISTKRNSSSKRRMLSEIRAAENTMRAKE